MSNGYTVVPNIIPGQLSVGGDLDVKGEIRVGAFTQRLHLFMANNVTAFMTYNMQPNQVTRDVAGNKAWNFILGDAASVPQFTMTNAAGLAAQHALTAALFTDYTQHNHTGTVTEDTIYSKTVRGNLLGLNGAVSIRVLYTCTAQGATASTLRVKLGATILASIPLPAARAGITCCLDVAIGNRNAANSQISEAVDYVSGAAPNVIAGAVGVDTTLDQALTVTIQNGATTDNQSFSFCRAVLVNTFGPVT